ncbi:MAG: glucosamine-6-phosphate deaminase [Candidatus Latescibacteria bacterium]|nr:glucosamine-6-phosphate deaminase [Candidatus Latescibacterota bacterium]
MRVIIQKNYDKVSAWAAAFIASYIKAANPTPEKPFVLGLPTGSTPLGMYKELIKLYSEKIISFENIVTFNMDEYVGIPENHEQSYHTFMWENFFNHIDIPKNNVNILDGNAKDLDAECENYEKKIQSYDGIDIFVGGVGPDGHIAFNEPGSSLTSRTRIKTLTEDTLIANSRFFNNDISKVPRTALTVGVGTVMDARRVMLLVTGHNKSRALHMGVEEGVNHMWTISTLQLHRHAVIVADEEATMELKVGTVRYFRDIESNNLDPKSLLK